MKLKGQSTLGFILILIKILGLTYILLAFASVVVLNPFAGIHIHGARTIVVGSVPRPLSLQRWRR